MSGVRSLSRVEAAERAAVLDVVGYHVEVDLTALPAGPQVRCTSTVRFASRHERAETFLDCCAEVVSATLNGRPVPGCSEGRIALGPLAADNVLIVESIQTDTSSGRGLHKAVDPADGEVYVWTSFEPDEARFVWACFDQPDLKAPYALTVLAPSGWKVVSNSGDPHVSAVSGDVQRWVFPPTPPLPTYLPVVLAGPFHEIRRELDGYDLGVFARRSLRPLLEREETEICTLTSQGLAFFGDVFGSRFPLRKYDQVFLPEYGGAMENYGCVAWSDGYLTRSEPSHAEREKLAVYLLHELAHMWFGNLVTMRWWDDLWLNETFAEFAALHAAERATRYPDLWASHLATAKLAAYRVDQGPTAHPIAQPVDDVAAGAANFDAITYYKGASVLQQLMTYVGEAAFWAGIRAYLAQHAWGNATLTDLMDSLGGASGRDLNMWRHEWLETFGPDRFTLRQEADQELTLLGNGPQGRPVRPQVITVGAYRREEDRLRELATADVEVRAAATPVDLPADADLYLVNNRDLTYVTSRPRTRDRDLIVRHAGDLPDSLARGVAAATAYDMLLAGEANTADVVHGLCEVVQRENSTSIIEAYLNLSAELTEHWCPEGNRDVLTSQVAAVCAQLVADPSHRRVALRVMARVGDEPALDHMADSAAADLDLQWRLLCRRAELGCITEGQIGDLLAGDPDPDAWVSALTVQACGPSPDDKAAVWQTLAEQRRVPLQEVRKVAEAFWRPDQEYLLARYADRYLDLLPDLQYLPPLAAEQYARQLFPVHGITASYPRRAETMASTTSPVVRKGMLERGDLVRRMLRARTGIDATG